jgi:hypothetical protein
MWRALGHARRRLGASVFARLALRHRSDPAPRARMSLPVTGASNTTAEPKND